MTNLTEGAQNILEFLVAHLDSVNPDDPRTFLSYKDVHDSLGLELIGKFGASLQRQGLNELAEWTINRSLPTITGIVIDRSTLQPGDGYFKLLGNPRDQYVKWIDEVRRAKAENWSPFIRAGIKIVAGVDFPDAMAVNPGAVSVWRLISYHLDGEAERVAEEMAARGVIGVGWSAIGDLSESPPVNGEDVGRRIRNAYPALSNSALGGASLWRLLNEVKAGDLVIVVARSIRRAVVEVTGDYFFSDQGVAGYSHQRPVVPTGLDPEAVWQAAGGDVAQGENVRWTLARLSSGGAAAYHAYVEGGRFEVRSTAIERNPLARKACIEHFGARCYVCNFDFYANYGDIGKGFIHVHHRVDLSLRGGRYQVDPINDLIPLCPNCHAMIHCEKPATDADVFKARYEERGRQARKARD